MNVDELTGQQNEDSFQQMLAGFRFPRGTYQEVCTNCGEKFFGRKNALLCHACSRKSDEWWDALTDEKQLAHMQIMIDGLKAANQASADKGFGGLDRSAIIEFETPIFVSEYGPRYCAVCKAWPAAKTPQGLRCHLCESREYAAAHPVPDNPL